MSTEQGKKIDEIRIEWNVHLVVRYHADDNSFTVEAGNESYKGNDLKELIEKGRLHMNGWSKLTWEPVIVISTEVYGELTFSYQRCYRSKHRNRPVFRKWKIGKENEREFGGYVRDDGPTADVMEGGEPGEVMSRACGDRVIPYTPARWTSIRELAKKLHAVLQDAASQLSEILQQKDLDVFLAGISGPQVPRLVFDAQAPEIEKKTVGKK